MNSSNKNGGAFGGGKEQKEETSVVPPGGELIHQGRLEKLVRDSFSLTAIDQIVHAFGYGSGVFSQEISIPFDERQQQQQQQQQQVHQNDPNKLVDLIFVVKDAYLFHQENYKANPTHYWTPPSFLITPSLLWAETRRKWSGDDTMATWFTSWQRDPPPNSTKRWLQNPGLYFNVTNEPLLKYGVIQVEDFLDDLNHWTHMYIAGRMHKPIMPLTNLRKEYSNQEDIGLRQQIERAQNEVNLPAALATALLLLSHENDATNKSQCSEMDIYHTIAGLSYHGDPRMQVRAEDPLKIKRLVQSQGQAIRFRALYTPALERLLKQGLPLDIQQQHNHGTTTSTTTTTPTTSATWTWNASSPAAQHLLWSRIPSEFQLHYNSKNISHKDWLRQQIASRVAKSARYQSLKGIVTAGPCQAYRYVARKLAKGLLLRK